MVQNGHLVRPPGFLQRGGAFYDHAQDLWPLIYTGCTVASFDSPLSNINSLQVKHHPQLSQRRSHMNLLLRQ